MSVWGPLGVAAIAAIAAACSFDRAGFVETDATAVADASSADDAPVFDATPPPDPLVAGDVRLIYAIGSETRLQNLRRSPGDRSWAAEPETDPFGGRVPWMVHRIGPTAAAEEIAMTVLSSDSGPEIRVSHLVDGSWKSAWSAVHGIGVSSGERGFDVEFEDSGDALAVYGIGTDTPAFRIYTAGNWSVERMVPLNDGGGSPNPDTNMGIVRWVELERRPGSDEIALAFTDDRETLVSMIWNGDVWELDSALQHDDRVKVNPVTSIVSNRAFDVAFEAGSGDLVVAWGQQNAAGFHYRVFDSTTRIWSPLTNIAMMSGTPHYVDLASDPKTDQVVGGFYDLGDGTERLGVGVWNGFSWIDTIEVDSQITDVDDSAIGDFPGEVAFLSGADQAIAVYADDATGEIHWARWQPGFSWAPQVPLPVPGMGQARSHDVVVLPGGNAALVIASDDLSQLFAAIIDGSGISLDAQLAPLSTELVDTMSTPFSVDVRSQ